MIYYKWRNLVEPIDQIFQAGGSMIAGGMTGGGTIIGSPEQGGRGTLTMSFSTLTGDDANSDASWTISKILDGSVFEIPLYRSVQLVSREALGASGGGLTWSNGQPWSNGQFWEASFREGIAGPSLEGSVTLKINETNFGPVLKLGKVFGLKANGINYTHKVMGIKRSPSSGVATIEISPPLRASVSEVDQIDYRPKMLAQCSNARSVASNYRNGIDIQLNDAKFVEYIP